MEFLFSFLRNSFLFSVFPFFPKDFRGSLGIKNPCFFGGFPCRVPKKQGKEDQGLFNKSQTTLSVPTKGIFLVKFGGGLASQKRCAFERAETLCCDTVGLLQESKWPLPRKLPKVEVPGASRPRGRKSSKKGRKKVDNEPKTRKKLEKSSF